MKNELPCVAMSMKKLIDAVENVPDDAELYLSVNDRLTDGNGRIGDIEILCGEYHGKNRNIVLFSTIKAVGNPFAKAYGTTATVCGLIKALNHHCRMTNKLAKEPNAFTSVSGDVFSDDTLLYAYCSEYGLLPVITVRKMLSKRTGKVVVFLICKADEGEELEKELTYKVVINKETKTDREKDYNNQFFDNEKYRNFDNDDEGDGVDLDDEGDNEPDMW